MNRIDQFIYRIEQFKEPSKKVLYLLTFLAGVVAACVIFISGYKLLGAVIAIGVLRALYRYLITPTRSKNLALKIVSPLLDATSLVAFFALLIIGAYIMAYALFSPTPAVGIIGTLIVFAGGICLPKFSATAKGKNNVIL